MQPINQVQPKTYGNLPRTILQFGEGNFLRAFVDYTVELANRAGKNLGSVVIAQPIANGMCEALRAQNCQYTVLMRGIAAGKVVQQTQTVTSVADCLNAYTQWDELLTLARSEALQIVVSNTTEAGIAYDAAASAQDTPPASFPAKLTVLLHARYQAFGGDPSKGLLLLPVELIDNNGDALREIVLRHAAEWGYAPAFAQWINTACCFANTLVDRIVTGFPQEEYADIAQQLGYEDRLLVTCEPFYFWAIACPEQWRSRFPVEDLGLDIRFCEDLAAYRTRKVRILNGAHTVSVLAAYLSGHNSVGEMVGDAAFAAFLRRAVFAEIIPTIALPKAELTQYANAVFERFANPFIAHKLLDISLNSVSKYAVRCLPSLLDAYHATGEIPQALSFGLAALLQFYQGECKDGQYTATRAGDTYQIRDDAAVLAAIHTALHGDNPVWEALREKALWGQDLTQIPGLPQAACAHMENIRRLGMRAALPQ